MTRIIFMASSDVNRIRSGGPSHSRSSRFAVSSLLPRSNIHHEKTAYSEMKNAMRRLELRRIAKLVNALPSITTLK